MEPSRTARTGEKHRLKRLPGDRFTPTVGASAKIRPPTGLRSLVDRPRLTRLSSRIPDVKVVLVRAPAGYGKTSLLTQWYRQLHAEGRPARWMTVDQSDNDPARLLASITAAVRPDRDFEGSATWLEHSPLSGGPISLVTAVSRWAPFVLFLDELEHVKAPAAYDILGRLIEILPEDSCLVIATREVPPLPLAALYVGNALIEVGPADLSFDRDEAEAFLRRHNVAIDADTVPQVLERTEGWGVGLQLIALATARREDPHRFIRDLTGSRREIADFLAQEVFLRLSDNVQTFLLETCVLDRMCASLCDAITGRSDGQETLEQLELAGLFTLPCDDSREWYRYHALFAQFLRTRIRRQGHPHVADLHARAARWYAENGLVVEAVRHAFAADDLPFAADLVASAASKIFRQGQFATVVQWAAQLPSEILASHPRIREAAAWAHTCLRNFGAARSELNALRQLAIDVTLDPAILDGIATVEPLILIFEDRAPEAMDVLCRNTYVLGSADPFNRGAFQTVMAMGLIATNEFTEASARLAEARANQERSGSLLGTVYCVCLAGLCHAVQGELQRAQASYREAKALIERVGHASPYVPAALSAYYAELLYEIGELAEAEAVLLPHFYLATESALPDMVACGYVTKARILAANGSVTCAVRSLEEAEVYGYRTGLSRLIAIARWERIRIALSQGAIEEALGLRDLLRATTEIEPRGYFHHSMETEARDIGEFRLLIRTKHAQRALSLIRLELRRAQELGRCWRALRLQILEAEALDSVGERRAALRVLSDAIRRGASQGFVRSFADEGMAIHPLLQILAEENVASGQAGNDPLRAHVEVILAASGRSRRLTSLSTTDVTAPIEELTDREKSVLALLAEGLSNKDLAHRLFLSQDTVKWHLRRIYAKMHVSTRSRAIAVARYQGIIPS